MNRRHQSPSLFLITIHVITAFLAFLILIVLLFDVNINFSSGYPLFSFSKEESSKVIQVEGLDGSSLKKIALTFLDEGQLSAAEQTFRKYFSTLGRDHQENIAGIYYNLAKNYLDQKNYSKSLELLNFGLHAQVTPDLETKILSLKMKCLEKKGQQAKASKLLDRVHSKSTPKKAEHILAQIGQTSIDRKQFERSLENLPPVIQKEILKSKENQKSFLMQLVLEELLYRKALKIGMNEDSDFLQNMVLMKKKWLASKVMETEFNAKQKPSATDVENFFKANIDQFTKEGQEPPSFDEVIKEVEVAYHQIKKKEWQQDLFQQLAASEKIEIYDEKI